MKAHTVALLGLGLGLAVVFAFAAYLEPLNAWRWSVLLTLCQ